MYRTKLCLGTNAGFGLSTEEQIRLFKQAGFDAFFTSYGEDIAHLREVSESLGMLYQSVHGPYDKVDKMWQKDEEAAIARSELLECVKICADNSIPIIVLHVFKGFGESRGPGEAGIENFRRVVEAAAERKVKIAFENTEGPEYLAAVMEAFRDYENVGFCWDTGHELCYNRGQDMMALYGDRLFGTHLNDNLGVRDYEGAITWIDDLHLLPFDGITDWNGVAGRLNRYGYNDILTFELKRESKPGRHENDKYRKMSPEEYVTEAYIRACRVAALKCR